MRYFIILLFCTMLHGIALGQQVNGYVTDRQNKPISGAIVRILDKNIGTVTSDSGYFSLDNAKFPGDKLVVSFVGFAADTISLVNNQALFVVLQEAATLQQVEITGDRMASYIDAGPAKTEVITTEELKKAACCDLTGCFETQGTVQAVTTNILTNAKELRILGLSGVYNQVLFEGMQLFQGSSYAFGISSYPGLLIKNIFVSKGANSVIQGPESIAGQINIVPPGEDETDGMKLNLFVNSNAEKQMSANYIASSEKWRNLLSVFSVQPTGKMDDNDDGFRDIPQLTRYTLFNQLTFDDIEESGLGIKLGLRYLYESRIGGQMEYSKTNRITMPEYYGQSIDLKQPEFTFRLRYLWSENSDIQLLSSLQLHNQESVYGTTHYNAEQKLFHLNVIGGITYMENHEFKGGFSVKSFDLSEQIDIDFDTFNRTFAGKYLKNEFIPGLFLENLLTYESSSVLTGIRLDRFPDNNYYVTPRLMVKHSFDPLTTIRLSAGTGIRTAHIFSENPNIFGSSRNINFSEKLLPERAYTLGVNFVKDFEMFERLITINTDLYHTKFMNQIRLDYDSDPKQVYVSNFTGTSVSNSFQIEGVVQFSDEFDAKIIYNYQDVYQIIEGLRTEVPMSSKNRALFSMSYRLSESGWNIDCNTQWFGSQRLPQTRNNPEPYRLADYSPDYFQINVQVLKSFTAFEIYAGIENITNFKQAKPIIAWQEPFSKYFDTGYNWGPIKGREFYLGLRYALESKDAEDDVQ